MLNELDVRSQEILRLIVDAYLETGAPVGSKTLATRQGMSLSSATIRNVMASLEDHGLLFSPHTSAGRLPTDLGLRLFVDGLLEVGSLTKEEQESLKAKCSVQGKTLSTVLEEATTHLSGLSHCAGLVMAPKTDAAIKHIEFVYLEPGKALVVLVTTSGNVENRVIEIPRGVAASSLIQASNFINAKLVGCTVLEALADIEEELGKHKTELDALTRKMVESGLAVWSLANDDESGSLIIKGQANLLQNVEELEDIKRIQALFQALERKESICSLLQATEGAEGVQIYIGAESQLFGLTDCSMVISPYKNTKSQIVGAIGVIGPTRINYARIIPMVDYTAKVISKLVG